MRTVVSLAKVAERSSLSPPPWSNVSVPATPRVKSDAAACCSHRAVAGTLGRGGPADTDAQPGDAGADTACIRKHRVVPRGDGDRRGGRAPGLADARRHHRRLGLVAPARGEARPEQRRPHQRAQGRPRLPRAAEPTGELELATARARRGPLRLRAVARGDPEAVGGREVRHRAPCPRLGVGAAQLPRRGRLPQGLGAPQGAVGHRAPLAQAVRHPAQGDAQARQGQHRHALPGREPGYLAPRLPPPLRADGAGARPQRRAQDARGHLGLRPPVVELPRRGGRRPAARRSQAQALRGAAAGMGRGVQGRRAQALRRLPQRGRPRARHEAGHGPAQRLRRDVHASLREPHARPERRCGRLPGRGRDVPAHRREPRERRRE